MSGEVKNTIKVASVYMATIIGAGFASGQEIVQFFSSYYTGGFYGIILAGVAFAIIGYVVLDKVYRERIRNYDEFLFPTVGWFMGWVMNITAALFCLSLFSIMIAGAGNIFQDKLGITINYGILFMALLCAAVILWDLKGVIAVSVVLTPVLTAGIVIIGLYILICKDTSVFSGIGFLSRLRYNWFSSSLLYVGYNSIMAIAIMCSLLPHLKTRRVGIAGGIIGGLALCIVALILNTAMLVFSPDILTNELPVLKITEKFSSLISNVYALLLWTAMFVSAITSGYCFIDRLASKVSINRKLLVLVVCAVVIPMSSVGFSNLISIIYPLFGYFGLFLVIATLIQSIRFKPRLLTKKYNKEM